MSSPLLKPRWLLGHVLVVVISVAFVALGFWQLSRHYDQRAANSDLEIVLAAPLIDLTELEGDVRNEENRRVTIRGSYDYANQLEQRPQSRNGELGYNQVVPLNSSVGLVLVNRGFVSDGPSAAVPERTGQIMVTGTVRTSQGTSAFGPQNPDEGVLATIARIDIERLNPQFGGALYPVYLDLVAEAPDAGGFPTVLPDPPQPTSRPNLLYAIQWWLFAAIASGGWLIYLRKQFSTRSG